MLVALGGLLALATGAAALTPGGGPVVTDCLAEFGGTPANKPATKPRDLRCIDNTACDEDPEVGVCRVRLEVCLNVPDPLLPGCAPAALDDYQIENAQPDTNPRHDFDLQLLQDQVTFFALPLEPTDLNVCSGEVFQNIRLPIRLTVGGARYRNGRKVVRATVDSPGGVEDVDRMRVVCAVADGTDPCDGVPSTFEQIQRHIFTPTCALPTCHNAAQGLHNMSLSPGDAYASLVGVAPANPAAAAAGTLRVDPGNVGNSFLVQKLRAQLGFAEGERMPLDLDPLRELNIQLVEQWIAAGAPAAGFVAPVGCH